MMLNEALSRLLFNIFRLISSHQLTTFFDMQLLPVFDYRNCMTRHLSYIDNFIFF